MKKIQNVYDDKNFFSAYKEMRDSKLNANELIEIPIMKEMLPDLKDKKILDLGCGDGCMSRFFVEKGAKQVVGVDISQNMINEAMKYEHKNIKYFVLPMEELDKLKGKYDIVCSSLAFHYVEDFEKLMKDISNKLKNNGYLVFSQEHPVATAYIVPKDGTKHIDIDGKRYYLVSDYNNNGKRVLDWNKKGVVKYHRNFETIISDLINAGFSIQQLREARPSKEAIKLVPKYVYQNDRPYFLFIKAKKNKR